ncbi:MAG: hypothetical protein RBR19_14975, partial [Sedimentisphaerales bacterium]|nr:hypothetical protein [Sedimentisphaerales bacterium]
MKSYRFVLEMMIAMLVTASVQGSQEAESSNAWRVGRFAEKDFFPVAVWLQSPANAPRYQAAGINLYVGLWRGPTQ